jgi:hypothetical protein
MEEGRRERSEKLTKVSRIDFLIHPGFIGSQRGHMLSPGEQEQYRRLLTHYIVEAHAMKDDELMVVFVDADYAQLREGKVWFHDGLYELQDILGKRLIVLGESQQIFPEDTGRMNGFDTVKRIARARGFTFNKRLNTRAYGEQLEACVDGAANFLNESGGLRNKTHVIKSLTDWLIARDSLGYGHLDPMNTAPAPEHTRIRYKE